MGIEPMDRRVRKTRGQLRECLTTLFEGKKIQDITVRELADMTDLNRGTFYLHYKDMFDPLEKIETELQEDSNQLVREHDVVDLRQRLSVIFSEIYYLVYDNTDLTKILLGENGDLSFMNRLRQLVREKCLKDWMEVFRSGNAATFDVFFSSIVSGYIGLIQYWLRTGLKETSEQTTKLTEHIIIKGIGVLEIDPYV